MHCGQALSALPYCFYKNINQQELQSKLIYICNYNCKIPSLLIFTFINTLPFSIKNSIFPGIPGNSKCFFDKLLLSANIMLNKKNADSVNNPLSAYNISNYIFVNSSLSEEFCCNFPELFRRQFELFAVEIHVVFALYGDQMDVCMRYFEP